MIITVTTSGEVRLAEVESLSRFHVETAVPLAEVATALRRSGAGELLTSTGAAIRIDYLLATVGALTEDRDWRAGFDAMLTHARTKSWITDDGASVLAHVEVLHTSYRVAVVGLGHQGSGIARLLLEAGDDLVGAVDVGEKVGRPIRSLVRADRANDEPVRGSLQELVDTSGRIDLAILSAAVDVDVLLDQARFLLDRGINVLTLHQDLFEPADGWSAELDRRGRATGASMLATGVQDTWWVHMPTVVAGSTRNIRSVAVTSCVDVNTLSAAVAREHVGVGLTGAELAGFAAAMNAAPPVLGAPLREAARRMGLAPLELSRTITPVTADHPVRWAAAGHELAPGTVIGMHEAVRFTTDRGITFEGAIRTVILEDGELPTDTLDVDGDPSLHLEYRPFPGEFVTNTSVVNRVPDVVEAPGGLLSAAGLPPARYRL